MLNLTKDQKVDLSKDNPGLAFVSLGLGWDVKDGHKVDVDAFAFCLTDGRTDNGGKLSRDTHGVPDLCFFNRKDIPGIHLTEDNRSGEGDGDDETIVLTLADIPMNVTSIVIGANIFAGAANFGAVKKCGANIYYEKSLNKGVGLTPAMKYDISEDFTGNNGIVFGEVYRHNGEWKFQTIGKPVNGDIEEIMAQFSA